MTSAPASLTEAQAAEAFGALGNRARLRLMRLLIRAGVEGTTVGELGRRMEMPASTLAHHLSTLVRAGLVVQDRRGREVICTANYAAIRCAALYLTEACCAGLEDLAVDDAPEAA